MQMKSLQSSPGWSWEREGCVLRHWGWQSPFLPDCMMSFKRDCVSQGIRGLPSLYLHSLHNAMWSQRESEHTRSTETALPHDLGCSLPPLHHSHQRHSKCRIETASSPPPHRYVHDPLQSCPALGRRSTRNLKSGRSEIIKIGNRKSIQKIVKWKAGSLKDQ